MKGGWDDKKYFLKGRVGVFLGRFLLGGWRYLPPKSLYQRHIRSFTIKENHIGPVVSEILRYKHTDRQTSCYFYIKNIYGMFYLNALRFFFFVKSTKYVYY